MVICAKPGQGNKSLRLEVRHNLCVGCNECSIARVCPTPLKADPNEKPNYRGAFYRDDAKRDWPGKAPLPPAGQLAAREPTDGIPLRPQPVRQPGGVGVNRLLAVLLLATVALAVLAPCRLARAEDYARPAPSEKDIGGGYAKPTPDYPEPRWRKAPGGRI